MGPALRGDNYNNIVIRPACNILYYKLDGFG